MVGVSVIILRKTHPKLQRGFMVPLVPILPIISIACCLFLMVNLPLKTWILRCLVSNRSSCILCLFEKHSHLKDDGSSQDNLEQAN